MTRAPTWLAQQASDTYTQVGEDGMIAAVFDVLGEGSRWCVELGAWDGHTYSNTRLLFEQGWSGVLIEADPERFAQLQGNYAGNDRAHLLCQWAGFSGPDSLENVLARTPVPEDFDLLSLDVDGNDLYLWDSLERFRPRLVVIEFNPTIPNDIEWVQKADPQVNQGASLLALTRFAQRKGYELVGVSDWNAFFVRREDYPKFEMIDNSVAAVRTDLKWETRVFQLFDGTMVYEGNTRLLWSNGRIRPQRLQALPRWARFFHDAQHTPRRRWIPREIYFKALELRDAVAPRRNPR